MIREQFRRYAVEKVEPHAHDWHLKDELIPMEVIEELAEMGVFGLTIPEEYRRLRPLQGLDVRRLRRAFARLYRRRLARHPLGDRRRTHPRAAAPTRRRRNGCPRLASGETLPTAVFTEPNTGSDLGSLRTRAVQDETGDWTITGNKTWITHAARTHVMTLLARTDPETTDYRGPVDVPRREDPRRRTRIPSPTDGMTRRRDRGARLSRHEGIRARLRRLQGQGREPARRRGQARGFKQLMETFECARIQTAARAIGVAQSALDVGMRYAQDRKQFGKRADRLPPRLGQARHDGGRDHGGAPAHLLLGPREGCRPPLRPRGRHGQAARRPRRVGCGRQRAADPRRQRLCAGIQRSAASSATPASSTSSRAPPKSRRR